MSICTLLWLRWAANCALERPRPMNSSPVFSSQLSFSSRSTTPVITASPPPTPFPALLSRRAPTEARHLSPQHGNLGTSTFSTVAAEFCQLFPLTEIWPRPRHRPSRHLLQNEWKFVQRKMCSSNTQVADDLPYLLTRMRVCFVRRAAEWGAPPHAISFFATSRCFFSSIGFLIRGYNAGRAYRGFSGL